MNRSRAQADVLHNAAPIARERSATDGFRPFSLLVVSSDCYPPSVVDVSVLFGEELAGRGHRIDWLMQSETDCEEAYALRWGGGTVWVGPTDRGASLLHRLRKHARSIAHDLKLFGLLRKGDYDLIEVKDKFVSGLFAAAAARLFGKHFVFWLSYPFPEDYLYRARSGVARYPLLYRIRGAAFAMLLYRVLLPRADHIFVQSEQMRRDVAAKGIARTKMTAVPMGIKLEGEEASPHGAERTLIPAGEPCLLYLGTLARVRRLDFLVRVLAALRHRVADAKLYVVGAGIEPGDERLLRDEAERLGLSSALVLVGRLPRTEALRYVREADVCVSPFYPTPTLNSTSPTKLVEYMAMGKAVVANDHPEQRLVIEESGAGFCVPWDEQAFADAVAELLHNPGLRTLMGERGRRYVETHRTYDKIATLVERELLSLLRLDKKALRS
ncbi:MAG TPA: glycosyltransferase family 4 protein [Gammaproteobacteria bacterium]|nr:glycosyltransferase family 4 protein [Gammaproteobacteria bacterium]